MNVFSFWSLSKSNETNTRVFLAMLVHHVARIGQKADPACTRAIGSKLDRTGDPRTKGLTR